MDALKKIMDKKLHKEGEMDPMKKKAKIELVEELRSMAEDMMKQDLTGHMDGLKKVTVASDSKEGLKEGLEKAEHIVEGSPEGLESEDEEEPDFAALSKEELLAKLMELKQKKA
jgi:hypothetical protein